MLQVQNFIYFDENDKNALLIWLNITQNIHKALIEQSAIVNLVLFQPLKLIEAREILRQILLISQTKYSATALIDWLWNRPEFPPKIMRPNQ